jgi:hypothetical protein
MIRTPQALAYTSVAFTGALLRINSFSRSNFSLIRDRIKHDGTK